MFVLVADEIGINELRILLKTCKRECASVYTVDRVFPRPKEMGVLGTLSSSE